MDSYQRSGSQGEERHETNSVSNGKHLQLGLQGPCFSLAAVYWALSQHWKAGDSWPNDNLLRVCLMLGPLPSFRSSCLLPAGI